MTQCNFYNRRAIRGLFLIVLLSVQFLQGATSQSKPNILWISCEDIGPDLSFYGDDLAKTPYLDELATQSTIYENAFSTTGVCAPSRSAIITGMYPTTIGTMHMRTGLDFIANSSRRYELNGPQDLSGKPIRQYSAVLPDGVKCFTEYLRQAGYYCTNDAKTDYQFASPLTAWDKNGPNVSYLSRAKDQPFFNVININITHESNIFKSIKRPITVDINKVVVPPYLPDTDSIKYMVARHYSNLELLDKEVGVIINQLKKNQLYDKTIIFFFSDHGGPLPREKREVYDSGTKVPLMIRYPNKPGSRNANLVSLIDLAPTVLELAGIKPPKYMEGKSLLKNKSRNYIYTHGDRFDEHSDRVRAIRDNNYLYIENRITNKTGYKDVAYRKSIYGMNELLELASTKKLNADAQKWFDIKSPLELYDVKKDPHQLYNLAQEKGYTNVIATYKKELAKILKQQGDKGDIPESQLINQMWPNGIQPKTNNPVITLNKSGEIIAKCSTISSSIVYQIADQKITSLDRNGKWELYTKPVKAQPNKFYIFVAERIGYETSDLMYLQ